MAAHRPGDDCRAGDHSLTSWPAGYGVIVLEACDSTNDEARRRAKAGEAGPLWISAKRQTSGRGRRGRAWIAPPQNLSATLLIRPGRSAAACAELSFAAALAASDMLADFAPRAAIALKWPNDVLAEGKKITGILLESETGPDGLAAWLAIGIGVNLAAYPEDTETPATSIAALGATPPSPDDALRHLAAAFAKWYDIWRGEGFAPIRAAWLTRAQGLGTRIRVRLANETITGTFRDIDENGALILGLPGGVTRTISAGDIFF